MADFVPLSQTDVCNLALALVGQHPIDDIDQTNGNAAPACRAAFWPAVTEVGRSHPWNCLRLQQRLTALSFPNASSANSCYTSFGWPGCRPSTLPPYWTANTVYAGGTLVTWGETIYYALYDQTSSTNFINDVTAGLWAQIYSTFISYDQGADGGLYPWAFGYALPEDFLLLNELNGVNCRGGAGAWGSGSGVAGLYEIYVNKVTNADNTISTARALFTDQPFANVQYTGLVQDTTVWDPLFVDCVSVLLASRIATTLRGDDGVMALQLKQEYIRTTLPLAKVKDAGEGKRHRYDPTRESNFIRARYRSTVG